MVGRSRFLVGLVVLLCAALLGPVSVSSAKRLSTKQRAATRAQLYKQIKRHPALIRSKSFIKRAGQVDFRLPITVRLRGATSSSNPNLANIDLGASLGQRQIGLGGDLAGEIVFHDSYDGGALGNVDVELNPGPKSLTTTSIPLLWNTDVTGAGTTVGPGYGVGGGQPGCSDFHGNSALTVGGHQTVPYWNTQGDYDSSAPAAGYVPVTPGVDDPSRLISSAATGNSDYLGPSPTPFPYSAGSTPGGFTQPPSPGDSVLRTAPLSLQVAPAGTTVTQTNSSANGPQGSQNIVVGKSGGHANLFGNIPGKSVGIDVTVSLQTRLNSILRSIDPDFQPLIAPNPWTQNFAQCRQAYTGAVQNYIPGVRLNGSLKISPGITSDGSLRIAKATLHSESPASVALAACIFPYSMYTAENNNSDTQSQTVSDYTTGGKLPTNEFVSRPAPNVNCGVTPTQLLQDAPVGNLLPAQGVNGYTTSVDGKRVSVAGDLNVTNVSADILVGDRDNAAPSTTLSSGGSDYYLALGDSIAYGYQSALFASTPNPAVFNFGYVDNFGNYLKKTQPGLTVVNDGCPGETSTSLVNGYNKSLAPAGYCGPNATSVSLPNGFPQPLLHHPYGLGNSQLQDATAFVTAHSNTKVVTLNIGANDLLAFLKGCGFPSSPTLSSCVNSGQAAQFATIVNNNKTILEQLQAIRPAGQTTYVVMGVYNPYPNLLAGGDSLVALLNSQLKSLADSHGAHFVDPLPVFNPSGAAGGAEAGDIPSICALTGMCPGGTYNPGSASADIHPSVKGYQALGSLFASASGM